MKNDMEQLQSLLGYWLEHNEEHAAEFREWADKISPQQKEVAELLRTAVDKIAESNNFLKKAKTILDKK